MNSIKIKKLQAEKAFYFHMQMWADLVYNFMSQS